MTTIPHTIRLIVTAILLLCAMGVRAQGGLPTRPDAIVTVQEHSSGREMVEFTMLDPKFPPNLLQGIVERLGMELGVAPSGFKSYVEEFGSGSADRFVKARIGVIGLIDRSQGIVRLQPLARAFSGLPAPHTVKALRIMFEGEAPNPTTISTYASPSVVVDGQISRDPVGLEYLVVLREQDPIKIEIPERHMEKPETPPAPKATAPSPIPLIVIIAVGSIAAGALVYFAVLSGGRGRR